MTDDARSREEPPSRRDERSREELRRRDAAAPEARAEPGMHPSAASGADTDPPRRDRTASGADTDPPGRDKTAPRRDKNDLHLLPPEQIVALLLDAERRVVPAVGDATAQIVAAAQLIAGRMREGGRLAFAGAGTSGRVAFTEAAELPGTFGLTDDRIVARMAGGPAGTDWHEDDTGMAQKDLADLALAEGDVLVAVAASGSTPYTLDLARGATAAGADLVAVVNTPGSPLAKLADVAIEVPVGPEVLRGSTRLSAGSAQKVALNAMTTTAMTLLGRVHGDVMVDVVAANTKLRGRAAGIVAEIAGCSLDEAHASLAACDWNTRAAILHLVGGLAPEDAGRRAAVHATLQAALNSIR